MAEEKKALPKDRAVPEMDLIFGFYLRRDDGELEWGVYQPAMNTRDPRNMYKYALMDILKNPRLHSLYFATGGIWMSLNMTDAVK